MVTSNKSSSDDDSGEEDDDVSNLYEYQQVDENEYDSYGSEANLTSPRRMSISKKSASMLRKSEA